MKKDSLLDDIETCAKGLVYKCVDFANEKDQEGSDRRLLRLFAAYLVASDCLTQGIKNVSSEFMAELQKESGDIRKDNL